jgi:Asp-tRNA(Asn)/Glu-tRNA(Gln) amidotransferase A subunit family amidase
VSGLIDILRILVEHDVEFGVVGGLAGVLQGAPVYTLDVDVIYARDPQNNARLLAALHALDASFRTDERELRPDLSHLESTGHKLLRTRHGVLDLLGTIEIDTCFEDLLDDFEWLHVAGMQVRVLSLERLIQVKSKLSRPKDQAMLLVLQATLDERNRSRG